MSSSSDVKRLLKDLVRRGWTVEQGRKHYKCYHPAGGFITVSLTPSCHHALRNIEGDINRLEKENEKKKENATQKPACQGTSHPKV